MQYLFKAALFKGSNRTYIKIPFNVWERCGHKGLVPVEVIISDISFECKLIPKGNGVYYIPVTKTVLNKIHSEEDLNVQFDVIDGLSRINHNSPYSKENPIRKIDSIESIIQPRDGLCGQSCIAMLAGIHVEEVIKVMNCTAWHISSSKMLETLDYFGITYADKIIYTRGKEVGLPVCCIINERREKGNHFLLYYKGKYYDSGLGVLNTYDMSKMIGYLEIFTELL